MQFEIISDVIHRRTPRRGPLFNWPDECFDSQQRLVTPAQVREMGYAGLRAVQASFYREATKRGYRAMCVIVKPCRDYPNGGLAVRALPSVNGSAPAAPGPDPEPVRPAQLPKSRAPRPVPTHKYCGCPDHDGGKPAPAADFDLNGNRADGLAAWCRDCSKRHYPRKRK